MVKRQWDNPYICLKFQIRLFIFINNKQRCYALFLLKCEIMLPLELKLYVGKQVLKNIHYMGILVSLWAV